MSTKSKEVDKYILVGALILLGLALFYVFNSYIGFLIYPREGFIGGSSAGLFPSFDDLVGFYYDYAQWIDFVLFLLIFLGLGKEVFKKQFKEGGKALYVGLGIFLALALVLWEVRTGTVLLELFGPIVLLFLALLVIFVMYKQIRGHISAGAIAAFAIIYGIAYVLAFWILPATGIWDLRPWYYSSWLYFYVPIDLMPVASLLFVISVIAAIFAKIFKK